MNNIRFTYEQKNQLFGDRPSESKEKEGIGKLLSKYERSRAVDDEQDTQIEKKKLVYHGNSLNYSQIYSDLRIDRKEKIYPEAAPNFNLSDSKTFNKKQQNQFQSSQNYIPKSLPKIRRNSRLSHNREPSKYVINNTFEECTPKESESFSRTKAFSISHYDIYKNQTKRQEFANATSKNAANYEQFDKNSDVLSSSVSKEIGSNIKVNFENIVENSLPEENDPSEASHSSHLIQRLPLQIQPEHSLEELNKDEIRLQKNQPEAKKKEISIRENKSQLNQQKQAIKQPVQVEDEKDDQLIRKDSRISRNSSIRSKQKEIKIEQIKREYSKKMEQESKRTIPEQKQTVQIQDIETEEKKPIQKNEAKLSQQMYGDSMKQSNNLPEIKHSLSSLHASAPNEAVREEFSKFKEEILKVKREISGVKEQMHEVKQSVEGVKEQIHKQRQNQQKSLEISQIKLHKVKDAHELSRKQSKSKELSYKQEDVQLLMGNRSISAKEEDYPKELVKVQRQQIKIKVQKGENKQEVELAEDTNRKYEFHKFSINDYIQVYQILKKLQKALKVPQIDLHSLIKEVKQYLEVVAMGGLDHLEGYQMPLHRLKIIKNAILYERISVVIIAFAYAVGKVKDSLKYLINLVGYATSNTLLILKILEGSEISSQTKNPVLAKSDRLVLKRNYDTIRNNSDIILDSIFKISKSEEAFYEPFKDILKSIGKNSIQQTFYNILEYFSFFLCVSELYKGLPFLAVAPNPYLRQSIDKRPTLVIDIIQVFCHGTKKSKNHVFRPHTQHFLNEMAQYYEIISFTCAYPNQIDKVIDILDQKHHIKHRLYRHHALMMNNFLYKDPERIGRDLSRLILLDSQVSLLSQESINTIVVPSWKGNKSDTTLAELCPILAAIALKKLDCREATKRIHDQQLKNQHAGIKYLNFGINLQ